ncbi:ATS3-like protein [Mya arenaria]|uniref:ATS3-like protein n=1 Tax=Mya arenaria TaxID=6604 RepID=A0ABY7FX53_MYAAR|nr:ATS3-like protein [Mya arenaria]
MRLWAVLAAYLCVPIATGADVDGEWSGWEAWTACTTTCGTGVTFRTRHCDNPAPAYNGSDCPGLNQDFSKCLVKHCPSKHLLISYCTFTGTKI